MCVVTHQGVDLMAKDVREMLADQGGLFGRHGSCASRVEQGFEPQTEVVGHHMAQHRGGSIGGVGGAGSTGDSRTGAGIGRVGKGTGGLDGGSRKSDASCANTR